MLRYILFCLTLVFLLFASRAYSQEWSKTQFPEWPKITIQDIKKQTFDSYGTGLPGSVTNEYRNSKPADGCPIIKDGVTIGWSMTCRGQK